jgi:hypothetical protein
MATSDKTVRINLLLENGQFKEAMKEAGIATGQIGDSAEKGALGGVMNLQAGAVMAGQMIGDAFKAAGAQIMESVKAASQYEEVHSKLQTVFSSISGEAQAMASQLQSAYGMSGMEAEKLLASTGDLLVGFQFSETAALDLSMQVQKMSADLASFQNIEGGASHASEIITKAMLGERDALVSLGVKISETDVKQKALAMGYKIGKDGLDKQTQAQVTLKLIMEQSAKAMGDFQRTEDSFANQQKILNAHLKDLQVELGQKLMPIFAPFVKLINGAFEAKKDLNKVTTELIRLYKDYKEVTDKLKTSQKDLTKEEINNLNAKKNILAFEIKDKLKEVKEKYESDYNKEYYTPYLGTLITDEVGVEKGDITQIEDIFQKREKFYAAYLEKLEKMYTDYQKGVKKIDASFKFDGKEYTVWKVGAEKFFEPDNLQKNLGKTFEKLYRENVEYINSQMTQNGKLLDAYKSDIGQWVNQFAASIKEGFISEADFEKQLTGMKGAEKFMTLIKNAMKEYKGSISSGDGTGGGDDGGEWKAFAPKIELQIEAKVDKEQIVKKLKEYLEIAKAEYDRLKPYIEKMSISDKNFGYVSGVVKDYEAMKELEDQLTFGMDDWLKKVENLQKEYKELKDAGHDTSGNLLEQRSAYEEMLKIETDSSAQAILKAEILGVSLKLEEDTKTVIGEQREIERDLEKIEEQRAKDLKDQLAALNAVVGYLNGMADLLGGDVSEGMRKVASGIEQSGALLEGLGVKGAGIFTSILGGALSFLDSIQSAINHANEMPKAWEAVEKAIDEAARHLEYYNTILQAAADTMELIRKGHEADDQVTKAELDEEKVLREEQLAVYLDQIAQQEKDLNSALQRLRRSFRVDVDEKGNILNLAALDEEIGGLGAFKEKIDTIKNDMKTIDVDSFLTSWIRDNDRADFLRIITQSRDLGLITLQEWILLQAQMSGNAGGIAENWKKFQEMINSTSTSLGDLITGLGAIKDTAGNIIDAGGDVQAFIEQIAGYDVAERLELIGKALKQLGAQNDYLAATGGVQTQNVQDQIALLEEQLTLIDDETEKYQIMTEIANLRKELEGDITDEIQNQITLTEELRKLIEGASFDTGNLFQIRQAMTEYERAGYSQAAAAAEMAQLGVKEQLVPTRNNYGGIHISINEAMGESLDDAAVLNKTNNL